jgi:hypothetical protein
MKHSPSRKGQGMQSRHPCLRSPTTRGLDNTGGGRRPHTFSLVAFGSQFYNDHQGDLGFVSFRSSNVQRQPQTSDGVHQQHWLHIELSPCTRGHGLFADIRGRAYPATRGAQAQLPAPLHGAVSRPQMVGSTDICARHLIITRAMRDACL